MQWTLITMEKNLSVNGRSKTFFQEFRNWISTCNVFAKLQKAPVKVINELCLYQSSWHHTSSYYNETDFYAIDEDKIAALTDEEINEAVELSRIPEEKPTEERWRCEYLEWYGTWNIHKAQNMLVKA